MNMARLFSIKLILYLTPYCFLLYVAFLLPGSFYEPSYAFKMPALIWLIHLFILYIHEAGHLLFSIFGGTLGLWGGSLLQVLVPFTWFLVAWREQSLLTPVALSVTGISIVDLSVYIKDAEYRLLPLLGGNKNRHDWWTILGRAGMLEDGVLIGDIVFFTGMLIVAGGIIGGVWMNIKRFSGENGQL